MIPFAESEETAPEPRRGAVSPAITPAAGTPAAGTPAAQAGGAGPGAALSAGDVRRMLESARSGDAGAIASVGAVAYALYTTFPEDVEALALLTEAQQVVGNLEYAAAVAGGLLERAERPSQFLVAVEALMAGGGFEASWSGVQRALQAHPTEPRLLAHGVLLGAQVPGYHPEVHAMILRLLERIDELPDAQAAAVHVACAGITLARGALEVADAHLHEAFAHDPDHPGAGELYAQLEKARVAAAPSARA